MSIAYDPKRRMRVHLEADADIKHPLVFIKRRSCLASDGHLHHGLCIGHRNAVPRHPVI